MLPDIYCEFVLVKNRFLFIVLLAAATPAFAYRNAVWIPPWDANALTSIQINAGAIQESNPVWYSMNADGSIAKNWNAENATWRAAMTGTRIVPTLQNVVNKVFDGNVAATLLASAASRDAHATAITNLVMTNAFDGIDVDYERVPATSRTNFTAFVQLLGQKLHAMGKTLSVTVYSKLNDKANWNGAGAEDWAAIGVVADTVKIMAYDYSNSGTAAGPITPLDWLDQVATYAQLSIPNQKIIVGLPWYGYDWSSTGVASVTYASAKALAQTNAATIARDANGEPYFTYSGHTVYYQDSTSYARKVSMLRQKHASIGGFAHWAAGVEDPTLWSVLRDSMNAPPTGGMPTTAADFALTGTTAFELQQGASASVDFRVVPVSSFDNPIAVAVDAPAGITASLNSAAMSLDTILSLRVNASASVAPGSYAITLHATSGDIAHDTRLIVTVTKASSSRTRAARR